MTGVSQWYANYIGPSVMADFKLKILDLMGKLFLIRDLGWYIITEIADFDVS